MQIKSKWATAIGVAAMIGMALWMHEIASWRPVLVGKVDFAVSNLQFSRDGRTLLIDDSGDLENGGGFGRGATFDLKQRHLNSDANNFAASIDKQWAEVFPRVKFEMNRQPQQLNFWPARGRKVALSLTSRNDRRKIFGEDFQTTAAWSEAQREVYVEVDGEILIWDWNTGKLKKRVRYTGAGQDNRRPAPIFSPDAQQILAFDAEWDFPVDLNCYEVATGQLRCRFLSLQGMSGFGFSPDGRFLWALIEAGNAQNQHFRVARNSRCNGFASLLWRQDCGAARWLPDGRIGIVQTDGFSWRDPLGREIGHLRNPFIKSNNLASESTDWILSPDGKWIYAAEQSGVIRRWRAK